MAAMLQKKPYSSDVFDHTLKQLLLSQAHDAWITATTQSGGQAWAFTVAENSLDAETLAQETIAQSTDAFALLSQPRHHRLLRRSRFCSSTHSPLRVQTSWRSPSRVIQNDRLYLSRRERQHSSFASSRRSSLPGAACPDDDERTARDRSWQGHDAGWRHQPYAPARVDSGTRLQVQFTHG